MGVGHGDSQEGQFLFMYAARLPGALFMNSVIRCHCHLASYWMRSVFAGIKSLDNGTYISTF